MAEIRLPSMVHFDRGEYGEDFTYADPDTLDQELFLDNLRKCGIPSVAARATGRSEIAYQVIRSKNKSFAAAWDWAIRESNSLLEMEARRRAVQGVEKTIWYKGEEVGTVIEYSDMLLKFLLERKHPDFGGSGEEAATEDKRVETITINTVPTGKFIDIEALDPEDLL